MAVEMEVLLGNPMNGSTSSYSEDLYNTTVASLCYLHPHLQYSIGITISLIGVVANLLFMYVVCQVPTMRTVLNAYLVNLAVSDLFHLLWHFSIWVEYLSGGIASLTEKEYCALMYFSRLFQYVSLLTVSVLSIERYLAICKPIFYRDSVIHRRRFIGIIIFCIWFFSCGISAEAVVDCLSPTSQRAIVGRVLFLFTVFSLMVLVFAMYMLIILAAKNSSRPVLTQRKERQIVRVCLTTALIHFICLSPVVIHTILLIVEIDVAEEEYQMTHYVMCLANISSYFLEINSSANPFIYNILSTTYRQAFKHALCCGKKSHRRGNSSRGHYMSARTLSTRSASTGFSPTSKEVCSM